MDPGLDPGGMVEGAHASCGNSEVGPLRQSFGLPPPRPGEDHFPASFASRSSSLFASAAA